MKCEFAFVVLHYLAYEMTKKCVDTLLDNFDKVDNDIKIIIVDNASPNNSGELLALEYQLNSNVTLIKSDTNLGFARGNNLGYKYAVETYSPTFVVVMNNDVLIVQEDFLIKIKEIYGRTNFGVLGPDIYCPLKGIHQSPSRIIGLTKDELLAIRKKRVNDNYKLILKRLFRSPNKIPTYKNSDYKIELDNPVLHGACYIFSSLFINKRKECFCNRTFLYLEEDILHYECLQEGIKMVYSPEISVNHLEDVSTKLAYQDEIKRRKNKNTQVIKSIDVLLSIMKKENENMRQ